MSVADLGSRAVRFKARGAAGDFGGCDGGEEGAQGRGFAGGHGNCGLR